MAQTRQRLSDICAQAFLFLTTFRRTASSGNYEPGLVRQRLLELLHEQADQARDLSLFEEWQKAKYLILVTADDLALSLDWPGRQTWRLLETEIFQTQVGGNRFFELIQDPAYRTPDLFEIFYLCLAVGFRGKYLLRGQDELDRVVEELYSNLQDVPRDLSARFTPRAYDETIDRDFTHLPAVNAAKIACILAGILLALGVGSVLFRHLAVGDIQKGAHDFGKSLTNH